MGATYTTPTETTAPVAGTTAGLYTFTTPFSKINVSNETGQTAHLQFNTSTAASATVYALKLESQGTSMLLEASSLGLHNITLVGVWIPTGGDVSKFRIVGA